jgi:hypothetical protein
VQPGDLGDGYGHIAVVLARFFFATDPDGY